MDPLRTHALRSEGDDGNTIAADTAWPVQARDGERDGGRDWTRKRKPESPYDRSLNLATRGWLAQLPARLVPHALARQYPRIANYLARLWEQPTRCMEYLDELSLDRRGDRQGFPQAIVDEIDDLAAHCQARIAAKGRSVAEAAAVKHPAPQPKGRLSRVD